ncbi:hypothetical protein Hypma_009867 [Hypsizygus marmoreus]|uniref:F-box domain-containing protein n=1 Tax=Hypsizygus marmoreus TaxID=39966 RepID=A0A369JL60_HYPMA|nr:hypothetical protein Hypma_009867 [Hypsizygus marmoreus]
MLSTYNLSNANPVAMPVDPKVVLTKNLEDSDATKKLVGGYAVAVGSLMYASLSTRTDITFYVSQSSRSRTSVSMSSIPDQQPRPAHPLETPELLEEIFRHSEHKDNAVHLLVCRDWFQVCKRIFWQHLDCPSDFERLVALLGEQLDHGHYGAMRMGSKIYSRINLSTYPVHAQWDTFYKYCALIQSVDLPDLQSYAQICRLITSNRTGPMLFPSLRALNYTKGSDNSDSGLQYLRDLFVQQTILRFSVRLPAAERHHVHKHTIDVIDSILTMANLVYLEITCKNLSKEAMESLHQIVGDLEKLETLVLPPYRATCDIVDRLATHMTIKEIRSKDIHGCYPRGLDVVGRPHILDDSYHNLNLLIYCANAEDVQELLSNGNDHFPACIQGLHLEMAKREYTPAVKSLFRLVQNHCPGLVDFCYRDDANTALDASSPFDPLPGYIRPYDTLYTLRYDTFQPIVSFSRLVTLHIRHHAALMWTADQLTDLAHSLPRIQSLFLNENPLEMPTWPAASIQILSAFARSCPKLTDLAIFLDALDSFNPGQSEPFRVLSTLRMGWSPISSASWEDVVALFIQLLPNKCVIDINEVHRPSRLQGANNSHEIWRRAIQSRDLLFRVQKRAFRPMITRGVQTVPVNLIPDIRLETKTRGIQTVQY